MTSASSSVLHFSTVTISSRYEFTEKRFEEGLEKIQKLAPKAGVFLWGIEQRIWRKELSYFFP